MMKRFVLGMAAAIGCALLFASHAKGADEPADPQEIPLREQSILYVTPRVAADIATIRANSVDILECEPRIGRPLMVQATPAHADALRAANLTVTIFHKNVEEYMDQLWHRTQQERMLRADDWYQAYRTFDEFNTRLDTIASNRPDLVTPVTIGTSLEGRPLRGLRVSAPDAPSNPRASRPILFLIGGQHAREWVGPATTLYAVDQLVAEYDTNQRVRNLLERVEVVSVPIINPDGYVYTWSSSANRFWRKNRRVDGNSVPVGVDNNRNWGFQWGLDSGSSNATNNETYRGVAPFSEPETIAIREFTFANPMIAGAVDIHTASQDMMGPWGFQSALSPDHVRFMSLLSLWRAAVQAVYNTPFDIGPIASSLYLVSGGSVDWWYGSRGILGITVELRVGGGFAPAANTIRPNCEEQYQGILTLGESIVTPIRIVPVGPLPTWIPADVRSSVQFTVESDAQQPDLTSVRLLASIDGGPYEPQPLNRVDNSFVGLLPAMGCGSTVSFYMEARTASGDLVRHPPVRGIEQRSANLVDTARFDAESAAGWELASNSSTQIGRWERGVPEPTSAQVASDSDDVGVNGWFTGLAAGPTAGTNDVDLGTTALLSPTFSLLPPSGMRALETSLSYWRTFASDSTADSLAVLLVAPSGASFPLEVLRVPTAPGRNIIPGGIPSPFLSGVRLRVSATDTSPDNTVEAGVDDVRVTMRLCRRSADMNGDQGVTIDDLLIFLLNFEAGSLPADYTNDLAVTIDDLLVYLVTFEDGV